ncbi:MAG TPA: Crp/Fnr family transcriptional regulator [Burkholderiales bacterium]|nr:Crp/Fnr family transcriptional regulator [Burkholderiales bacterium]
MQSSAATLRRMRSLPDQRLIEGALEQLALFRELGAQRTAAAAKQCCVMSGRRGEVLARRGSRLPGIFVVAYGIVKLALRGQDGDERVLRLVSSGQGFGEATALLGERSRYEASALADCKLVMVPSSVLWKLLETEPRFARRMMLVLGGRALEMMDEVEAATLQRGSQRLARYLQSLGASSPTPGAVRLPVSKTLVAARLGVKKETLSRLLHQLAAEGVIRVERRDVKILDAARLRSAAGEAEAPPAKEALAATS